jgi:hypothetical protein
MFFDFKLKTKNLLFLKNGLKIYLLKLKKFLKREYNLKKKKLFFFIFILKKVLIRFSEGKIL